MSLSSERLYRHIARCLASNGEAPTMPEMQRQFGIRSPATVYEKLRQLENQGLIERTRKWRGITLTEKSR